MKKIFSGPLIWGLGLIVYFLFVSIPWSGSEFNLPPLAPFFSPMEGFWQNADAVSTPSFSEVHAPLSTEVQIIYDRHAIPHIFADNLEDAMFAMGYLHAKDRLFQMDFTYRAASGKMSEIFGSAALEYDLEMRRKGMGHMIENITAKWEKNQTVNRVLDPYITGVNSYISELKRKNHPIEFKLIHYSPALWDREKSASMLAYLNHELTFRHEDIEASQTLNMLGGKTFHALYPMRYEDIPPVLPDLWLTGDTSALETTPSAPLGKTMSQKTNEFLSSNPVFGPFNQPHLNNGSNNWAVGSAKTLDGSTIIANDTHLPLTLPSIWYECHIVTPDQNFYGYSIPGIPGIFLGMSQSIAIATTNVGCDYVDWYQMDWRADDHSKYAIDGEERSVEWREEKIAVRGMPDHTERIPYTTFGPAPFVSEVGHPMQNFALNWRAHQPEGDLMKSLIKILNAESFEEFIETSNFLSDPPQNLVYIDKSGNIGLRISGSLPIRRDKSDGRYLKDGSLSDSLLNRFIPTAELPTALNPEDHFVASANQISTGTGYPYPQVGVYSLDRGTYLFNRLESMQEITLSDMQSLQTDNTSQKAIEMLEVLLPLTEKLLSSESEVVYWNKLDQWDRAYSQDATIPILFEKWSHQLLREIWSDLHARNREAGKFEKVLIPNWKTSIQLIERDGMNPGINLHGDSITPSAVQPLDSILINSLRHSIAEYESWVSDNSEKSWPHYRGSHIPHMTRIESFSHSLLKGGGTGEALNSVKATHGPSMRMIAQFNRNGERQFLSALPGGTSGNPGSPFYNHRIEDFENGTYIRAYLGDSPADLADEAIKHLKIKPSDP